jgi:two-component system nitrate/nitrite response regulator NarL
MRAPEEENTNRIKVILAEGQVIFRVGISKILCAEKDIRVLAEAQTLSETLSGVAKLRPDVLLFDSNISPSPIEAVRDVAAQDSRIKIVVMSADASEDDTIAYLSHGVRGIISRAISPDLLVRCVRKVSQGETWLDNEKVNWVIHAYREQSAQLRSSPKSVLSEKELIIVAGVTQGLRNKDIAEQIGTTEQVIKNYLRKIYDKLGLSDRLELALYCLHNRILERSHYIGNQPELQKAIAAAVSSDGNGSGR